VLPAFRAFEDAKALLRAADRFGLEGYRALANGHGWHRFLNSVDLVLPKRGKTLDVPIEMGEPRDTE